MCLVSLVAYIPNSFHSHLCLLTGMDGDVVARNIREFEKTHEDVGREVWIVG